MMASERMSGSGDNLSQRTRITYRSLHRWPESDIKFVKSVADNGAAGSRGYPQVMDSSYSCRQMYLRSYPFSKEDTVPVKGRNVKKPYSRRESRKRPQVTRKVKWSCTSAVSNFLKQLLSCTSN